MEKMRKNAGNCDYLSFYMPRLKKRNLLSLLIRNVLMLEI